MAGGQRLISWLHPCSISNVTLITRTCAHGPLVGHPNWVGCDIHPPPPQRSRRPRLSNLPVQCRPIHHVVCPIPSPHADAYVRTLNQANVQEPSLLVHGRMSSADPYVMSCVPSQAHTLCTLCSHTDPYTQPRGSALILFVTPRLPPKVHRPTLP
jgi:hypothetical protein